MLHFAKDYGKSTFADTMISTNENFESSVKASVAVDLSYFKSLIEIISNRKILLAMYGLMDNYYLMMKQIFGNIKRV